MGELRAPQERRGLGLVGENIPEVKAQLQTSVIWMLPRTHRGSLTTHRGLAKRQQVWILCLLMFKHCP